MRILIASDSFKDALSATRVCRAIGRGLKKAGHGFSTQLFPLADGGEGTAEILAHHLDGQTRELTVKDPLYRPHTARYLLSRDKQVAFIEMAQAAGLDLLKPAERNPLETTTWGVGELIRDAVESGAERILLAIGGSATNDAGTGMAAALGYAFLDKTGQALEPSGKNLIRIRTIVPPKAPLAGNLRVEVLCDVSNPLFGPAGAAFVYAPQKGADPEQVRVLDEGLRHIGDLFDRASGKSIAAMPGSGAAGGLGAGAVFFLDAVLQPGAETILELCRFDSALQTADLLITGEGRLDDQTLNGKLIGTLCRKAGLHQIPVVALCGDLRLTAEKQAAAGLTAAFSIAPGPISLEEALSGTERNLEKTAEDIGRLLAISGIGRSPVG